MKNKFVQKKMYHLGSFCQLDAVSPLFLDKTGELIANTEGEIKNWNGGINGFQFSSNDDRYSGKVDMNQMWFQDAFQGDFNDKRIPDFHEFIIATADKINSIFKPNYYKRIGFRTQFILKKTSDEAKELYTNFYTDRFQNLVKFGKIETTSIGFDLNSLKYKTRININYALRKTENDLNSPADGLLFDLDFSETLDKLSHEEIINSLKKIMEYSIMNYQDILTSLSREMGVVHEN